MGRVKERGQTAAERRHRDRKENSDVSQRLVRDLRRGSICEARWEEEKKEGEWETGKEKKKEGKKEREWKIVTKRSTRQHIMHMFLSSPVVLWWNKHGIHLITSVSLKNMDFHKCADKCSNHSRFEFSNKKSHDVRLIHLVLSGQSDTSCWFIFLQSIPGNESYFSVFSHVAGMAVGSATFVSQFNPGSEMERVHMKFGVHKRTAPLRKNISSSAKFCADIQVLHMFSNGFANALSFPCVLHWCWHCF